MILNEFNITGGGCGCGCDEDEEKECDCDECADKEADGADELDSEDGEEVTSGMYGTAVDGDDDDDDSAKNDM